MMDFYFCVLFQTYNTSIMAIRPGEKPKPQKYHHHLQYCMKFKAEDTNIATASCDVGMSELHTRFLTTPAKIRSFCSNKIDDFKNKKIFIDPYDRARHISDYTKTLGDDWYLEYFFSFTIRKFSALFQATAYFLQHRPIMTWFAKKKTESIYHKTHFCFR